MGSGGGGGGGGGGGSPKPRRDPNRGVARGRTAEPARPAPSKPKAALKATKPSAPREKPSDNKFGVTKRKVATTKPAAPAPKAKPPTRRPDALDPPSTARPPAKTGAKLGDTGGAASEKMREVGVRYTPTSTPDGGLTMKADIRKTGPSGDLARIRGASPGDVLATVGTLPTVSADVAAANIAGRPGLNRDVLGDLAKRARVGQLPPGEVQIPGVGTAALNILNTAGTKSAMTLLTALAKDEPTMKDGKIEYGTEIVKDERGGVAGLVDKSTGRFTGRPDLDPTAPVVEKDPEPVIQPEIQPEITPEVTPERDDEPVLLRGRGAAAKRRSRSARFGQAGTVEGEGILLRTPSSQYGG